MLGVVVAESSHVLEVILDIPVAAGSDLQVGF